MKMTELQFRLIKENLKVLTSKPCFYKEKFKDIDIDAIKSQEDFEKLPFTWKGDLRDAYPLGLQAEPDEEIVRIHSSSGTTGTPVIIPYTQKDVDDWAKMFARCYEMAGITALDRIQITPGYGLWTAGIGFQLGAEHLGAMTIPMGPGNTEKQLRMMQDLKATVLCATSSYALLLAEEIAKRDLTDKIYLKKGVIGSERWGDKMRKRIAAELGVQLYDIYGLTEVYGPGIAMSCDYECGMHYWDDYVYFEIVDPKTGEPVPDGEIGELVMTCLCRQGMPILRYRTRDLTRFLPGECSCGRHHRRIDRILGRADDMFIIKGVNVYPMQIEQVIMTFPEVGQNYCILLENDGIGDVMRVQVEIRDEYFVEDMRCLQGLQKTIAQRLRDEILVTPRVELVQSNSLPSSEGKAVRVYDNRAKK